jgi:ABC-type transport system involved in cytochrome c biogenesis permease subunit
MIATFSFTLLLVSALIQAIGLFRKDGLKTRLPAWISLAGALLLVAEMVQRSIAIQFVAITSVYESLVFLTLLLAALVAFLGLAPQKRAIPAALPFGATAIAVVFLALASSPLAPPEIRPPVPALQSGWLVLHVSFTFIGEVLFTAGFITAILQLFSKDPLRKAELDRLTYTSIGIGYPIFTAGALVFGAVWAEKAWGIWWSWDPKETWALVTWLTYTAYLHLRLVRKKSSSLVAALVIVGFIVAMFTFFGVNFLLAGLHSYA